jgi:hypothetical protein
VLILLGLGVRHTGLLKLLFALVWCVHWGAVGLANKLARKLARRNRGFRLESSPCLECFLPNKNLCNLPYCRCEVEKREERLSLELWRDQTPELDQCPSNQPSVSVSLEDGARKEPKETGTHTALIKLSSKNKQISSIMHGNLP